MMRKGELEEALAASATEVLETMFFTWLDPEGADRTRTPDEHWVSARLRFRGAPSGNLAVSVSPAAARSMAAGFLGLDEGELTEPQISEVVCEVANMVCGSLLSRVEGETSFELMHPELIPAPSVATRSPEASATAPCLQLALETGGLAVLVEFETENNERPRQDQSSDR